MGDTNEAMKEFRSISTLCAARKHACNKSFLTYIIEFLDFW